MKKHLLLSVIFLFLLANGYAQTIKGQVFEKGTNNPLVGATVSLQGESLIGAEELKQLLEATDLTEEFAHVNFQGLMGMATNTDDHLQIEKEFKTLQQLHEWAKYAHQSERATWQELSMGMSGDYKIALECGSTMVRIGSALFGARSRRA